jgi:hypothetical protein
MCGCVAEGRRKSDVDAGRMEERTAASSQRGRLPLLRSIDGTKMVWPTTLPSGVNNSEIDGIKKRDCRSFSSERGNTMFSFLFALTDKWKKCNLQKLKAYGLAKDFQGS